VVYFTELDEENREAEFNAAMDGENFYDGFIEASAIQTAKSTIAAFVARLNEGSPEAQRILMRCSRHLPVRAPACILGC
jgi:hypothetical protein